MSFSHRAMLHTRYTSPTDAKPQLPVWKVLFDRQTALLHRRAAPAFGLGIATLGLSREAPPDLARLERQLRQRTRWNLMPVSAPLNREEYFAALGSRHLPIVTGLRAAVDFERAAPDLFADVFGRLPLLLVPAYAEFLADMGQLLGEVAPVQRAELLVFHRATADFGTLANESGLGRQVFGARLLTSARHLHAALASPVAEVAQDWEQLLVALAEQRAKLLPATASGPMGTLLMAA